MNFRDFQGVFRVFWVVFRAFFPMPFPGMPLWTLPRTRPGKRVTIIMVGFVTTEATIKMKHFMEDTHIFGNNSCWENSCFMKRREETHPEYGENPKEPSFKGASFKTQVDRLPTATRTCK